MLRILFFGGKENGRRFYEIWRVHIIIFCLDNTWPAKGNNRKIRKIIKKIRSFVEGLVFALISDIIAKRIGDVSKNNDI